MVAKTQAKAKIQHDVYLDETMKRLLFALCLLVPLFANADHPAERKFVREGMSEGQLLVKVGRPDSETLSNSFRGAQIKQWIYLPDPGDPQTVTTVTIVNAQVVQVTREVSR
jgi:hypothetical protein